MKGKGLLGRAASPGAAVMGIDSEASIEKRCALVTLHFLGQQGHLSRPRQHEAISLGRYVLSQTYPPPIRAQPDLVDLPVAGKAAVRSLLSRGVCCIQAEHCSQAHLIFWAVLPVNDVQESSLAPGTCTGLLHPQKQRYACRTYTDPCGNTS